MKFRPKSCAHCCISVLYSQCKNCISPTYLEKIDTLKMSDTVNESQGMSPFWFTPIYFSI